MLVTCFAEFLPRVLRSLGGGALRRPGALWDWLVLVGFDEGLFDVSVNFGVHARNRLFRGALARRFYLPQFVIVLRLAGNAHSCAALNVYRRRKIRNRFRCLFGAALMRRARFGRRRRAAAPLLHYVRKLMREQTPAFGTLRFV